ncbi:MAG: hypothetical protein CMP11_07550, partial [Zetaproteobacteria bacterium]|nr:hypothetical protein [Pseudobdellovibrionaceae bacterium]
GVDEDVYINTKKNFQQKTRVIIEPIQLQAPIRKGDPVALLKIEGDYLTKPIEQQLIAREDVQRTNVFKRLLRKMMTYIGLEVPKPALNFAEKELKDTLNI